MTSHPPPPPTDTGKPAYRVILPAKANDKPNQITGKELPAFQTKPPLNTYSLNSNRNHGPAEEIKRAGEFKTSAFSGTPNDEMQRLVQNNGGPEKIKWRNYELDLTGGSLKNGRIAPEGLASLQEQPAAAVHTGQTPAPVAPQPG